MAQNITILGASYSNVPAVTLPKTGGGTARFTDVSDSTVTASTVLAGYKAYNASGEQITGSAKSGSAYQDADGYVVIEEDESSSPQGTLAITANGTYDVSNYAGATVDIGGMNETQLKNFIQRSNNFTDIDWPNGLTSIGSYAFELCTSFNPSSLPEGIVSIGDRAFDQCFSLTLTSLPDSITSIGASAFTHCQRLALVNLPSKLTVINSGVFTSCYLLALTSLPNGLTSIGTNAFQGCRNLSLTSIPTSVTSISSYAFYGCSNLQTISCDGTITVLGANAFNGTSPSYPMQLVSASFPNMALASNISTVFGNTTASMACQLLEFCDIGSTVGIAANAFANCYALETLVLRKTASVCTLAAVSAFTNTPMSGYNNKTGTVYVPSALISSYQTATNWSTLYNNGTVTFAAIEGSEYERN